MPTTPYAKILVSVDGGALTSGGLTVAAGASIHLQAESTAGWSGTPAPKWEIYEYPEGWTCPAGWSTDDAGVFYFDGVSPPDFDLPDISLWGKFFLRLTVSGSLVDEDTALSVLSTTGFEDVGYGESNQFDTQRQWIGSVKRSLRQFDAAASTAATATTGGTRSPVKAAATGNVTRSGTQTLDGVACGGGDRVLLPFQTDGATNGLYIVASGAWARAADANSDALVVGGMAVPVQRGTQRGVWVLTTVGATLGTTPLVFIKQSDTYNVQLFGAVLDGVANDTSPIQAALNALPSAGGTVIVPDTGHVPIVDSLSFPNPTRLLLNRGGLMSSGADVDLIQLTANVVIEGHSPEATVLTPHVNRCAFAIGTWTTTTNEGDPFFTLRRLKINGGRRFLNTFGGTGIFEGLYSVEDCVISGTTDYAITIESSSYYGFFNRVQVVQSFGGIHARDNGETKFRDCIIKGNQPIKFTGIASIASGSRTLTLTGPPAALPQNGDAVGNTIRIRGAGPGGRDLTGTILAVSGATVTLEVRASTTVNNVDAFYQGFCILLEGSAHVHFQACEAYPYAPNTNPAMRDMSTFGSSVGGAVAIIGTKFGEERLYWAHRDQGVAIESYNPGTTVEGVDGSPWWATGNIDVDASSDAYGPQSMQAISVGRDGSGTATATLINPNFGASLNALLGEGHGFQIGDVFAIDASSQIDQNGLHLVTAVGALTTVNGFIQQSISWADAGAALPQTTVAGPAPPTGSDGQNLATLAGDFFVATTTGFPSSGTIYVQSTGPNGVYAVTYTGKAAGKFTGCSSAFGSGLAHTGGAVSTVAFGGLFSTMESVVVRARSPLTACSFAMHADQFAHRFDFQHAQGVLFDGLADTAHTHQDGALDVGGRSRAAIRGRGPVGRKMGWFKGPAMASAKIGVGSNGVSLPVTPIHLSSAAGLPTAGTAYVRTDKGMQEVTYTGISGSDLTGCSGGVGTMSTNGEVRSATAGAPLYLDEAYLRSGDNPGDAIDLQPRRSRGRRLINRVVWSEDSSHWGLVGPIVATTGQSDPWGGTRATKLVRTGSLAAYTSPPVGVTEAVSIGAIDATGDPRRVYARVWAIGGPDTREGIFFAISTGGGLLAVMTCKLSQSWKAEPFDMVVGIPPGQAVSIYWVPGGQFATNAETTVVGFHATDDAEGDYVPTSGAAVFDYTRGSRHEAAVDFAGGILSPTIKGEAGAPVNMPTGIVGELYVAGGTPTVTDASGNIPGTIGTGGTFGLTTGSLDTGGTVKINTGSTPGFYTFFDVTFSTALPGHKPKVTLTPEASAGSWGGGTTLGLGAPLLAFVGNTFFRVFMNNVNGNGTTSVSGGGGGTVANTIQGVNFAASTSDAYRVDYDVRLT